MLIQAEISLYPLGEPDLTLVIHAFLKDLERPGIQIETGPLSSVVSGESEVLFAALREAFERSSAAGRRALVVKFLGRPMPGSPAT